MEEIFSLVKELKERDNARGQRVEKNTEEEQKEGPLPLRTETKNDEGRQEQKHLYRTDAGN